MIPQTGQMVKYRLSTQDAVAVNRRRKSAARNMSEHQSRDDGSVIYVGNAVSEGDTYPMLIVRCWGDTEQSSVNGQVFLDGDDVLWVTSVQQGDAMREWKDINL